MDPFTQRMLDRAKIRRAKLDGHFACDSGKDHNLYLPETNGSDKENQLYDTCWQGLPTDMLDKQGLTETGKSKLQKLAKFYADDSSKSGVSEQNDRNRSIEEQSKPGCTTQINKCKFRRLAALAARINQWEDDTAHSKQVKTSKNNEVNDGKLRLAKDNKISSWDPIVEKLCFQGYSLSENQNKITYEFGEIKESKNIDSSNIKGITNRNCSNVSVLPDNNFCGNEIDFQSKREKPISTKVAFFEHNSKNEAGRQVKDPAELSLAERRALFEQNSVLHSHKTPKKAGLNKSSKIQKFICSGLENSIGDHITKFTFDLSKEKDGSELQGFSLSQNLMSKVKAEEISETKKIEKEDATISTDRSPKKLELEQIPEPPTVPENGRCEDLSKEGENNFCISYESGRLYPSLSDLDVTDVSASSQDAYLNESKSNVCLNMSLSELLEMNKNNPVTPPNDISFSKSKECQVLNKMDKLLENALNDLSSETEDDSLVVLPSPPKIKKSSSFEYKSYLNANDQPLVHTVSFYRKQQQSIRKNPCSDDQITGHGNEEEEERKEQVDEEDQSLLVDNKIQMLLAEINKQQTIISQASQALNLCLSTVEFTGSGEQVEGERLLLLASHKRQACLNEIQRLKIENKLFVGSILTERGDVILSNISVKLKRDALRSMAAAENLQYFVCLIKSDERVLATPVVPATRNNLVDLNLQFPGSVKLESLLSNFKITIEVYSLELSKELLPHDVKYHLVNKKEKKLLTPIKTKKCESKLVKPHIQSPAGPNAIRTSNFQMCGYVVFSLREVNRTYWMLNKVPYVSSVEGSLSMNVQSQLHLDDEFRGFLTMFDDISGFGAWHRRWCLLSSHFISFWKYPDDEHKKVPIGTIDLRSVVTDNVGLVSRDICARPHTFLLETTRPRLSEDVESLVLNVQDNVTTLRHLLSADGKQEMMDWCKRLNTTLALLRSWKCNFDP